MNVGVFVSKHKALCYESFYKELKSRKELAELHTEPIRSLRRGARLCYGDLLVPRLAFGSLNKICIASCHQYNIKVIVKKRKGGLLNVAWPLREEEQRPVSPKSIFQVSDPKETPWINMFKLWTFEV